MISCRKFTFEKISGLFRIPHPGLSTVYLSYRLHVFQIMVSSFQLITGLVVALTGTTSKDVVDVFISLRIGFLLGMKNLVSIGGGVDGLS